MSTLQVTTIKSNSSAAPVFQNTSGTEKGQLAKAWINYNGTGTVSIRDSFNVCSLTDNGEGLYTITFTNAMSNNDYCVQCTSHMWEDNSDDNARISGATNMSTTSFRQCTIYGTGTYQDAQNNMAAVFGD